MFESNTAAICKSDGKETIQTLSGTAWQGNSMGTTWERHGMCELAFRIQQLTTDNGGTLLVVQLVYALHYKSEGRGIESRWCHWNFSLT
jgi:hypothetical protein